MNDFSRNLQKGTDETKIRKISKLKTNKKKLRVSINKPI